MSRTLSNDPKEIERRDPRVANAQDAERVDWKGAVTERVAEADRRRNGGDQ